MAIQTKPRHVYLNIALLVFQCYEKLSWEFFKIGPLLEVKRLRFGLLCVWYESETINV